MPLLPGKIGLTCLHTHPLECAGIQNAGRNGPSAVEGAVVLRLAPLLALPGIIGTYISSRAVPVLSILEPYGTFIGSISTLSPSKGVKVHEFLREPGPVLSLRRLGLDN